MPYPWNPGAVAPRPRVAFPLGPQLASVRGTGRAGGQSSTDDKSALDTAVVQAPPYSAVYTARIGGFIGAGMDGRDMQATYQPYIKRVALYTQPGYQSAAPWQEDQYAEDARELLQRQPVPVGQMFAFPGAIPARPPVSQLDYNLLQSMPRGNDQALMTGGYYG